MAVETAADSKALGPPYVSFTAFVNLLDWLKTTGIPLQLDRSFWGPKFSGAVGPQLMSGLRFLGLLEGDQPVQLLEDLVNADAEGRKLQLRGILTYRYAPVFQIGDISRATVAQIHKAFDEGFTVSGDTVRKAESFFLNACKYADIKLMSSVSKQARNRRSGTATKTIKKTQGTSSDQKPEPETPSRQQRQPDGSSNTRVVRLRSGGQVTVSVMADLFSLSEEDRQFVFGLIDQLRSYEATNATPSRLDEAVIGKNGEAPELS